MKHVFIYTFLLVTLKIIKGKIFLVFKYRAMKMYGPRTDEVTHSTCWTLVITAVTLKSTVFSIVKSCGSLDVH
jgi:hypothetical protein